MYDLSLVLFDRDCVAFDYRTLVTNAATIVVAPAGMFPVNTSTEALAGNFEISSAGLVLEEGWATWAPGSTRHPTAHR
jgi:hypothetical protein